MPTTAMASLPIPSTMSGGRHGATEQQQQLAYNEMSIGAQGSVLNREQKREIRQRYGYCTTCEGPPTQLYKMKNPRLPWLGKETLSVPGECDNGICYRCEPEKNPNPVKPRRRGRRQSASDLRTRPGLNGTRGVVSMANIPTGGARGVGGGQTVDHSEQAPPRPGRPTMSRAVPQSTSDLRPNGDNAADPFHPPARHPSPQRPRSPPPRPRSPPRRPMSPHLNNNNNNNKARRKPAFDGVYVPDSYRDLAPEQPQQQQQPPPPPQQQQRPANQHRSSVGARDDITNLNAVSEHEESEGGTDNLELYFHSHRSSTASNTDLNASREQLSASLSTFDRDFEEAPGSRSALNASRSSLPNPSPTIEARSFGRQDSHDIPPLRDLAFPSNAPDTVITKHDPNPMSAIADPLEGSSMHVFANPLHDDSFNGEGSVSSSNAHDIDPLTPQPVTPGHSTESEGQVDSIIDGLTTIVKEMNTQGGASDFLAEVIVSYMREHSAHERVQACCLRFIWDICKDNDGNKASIMAGGAPDDIVRAMNGFPGSATVQEKGCGAIWSLGVESANRIILVRAGSCECIVQAMEKFVDNESLVRTALGALRTLSPEAEAREKFKELQASAHTVKAMEENRTSASIQRDGCAVLSNCAVNIEKQIVSIVPHAELDAVVQAMANHREEVSVLCGALFALKNYTYEAKNCRTLCHCNGVEELLAYATQFTQTHPCPPDSAENATEVLDRMQVSRAADESIEDQALRSLHNTVEAQAANPLVFTTIDEVLKANDWSPRLVVASIQSIRQVCVEHHGQRETIFHTNVLKTLSASVIQHELNEEVAEEGCRLLATLAENERGINTLIEIGWSTTIFGCLSRHKSTESVVKAALTALAPLSTDFGCWRDDRAGRMKMIQDIIQNHSGSEEIQMYGVSILSSLDQFRPN